jgi:hypothetical protein
MVGNVALNNRYKQVKPLVGANLSTGETEEHKSGLGALAY